MVKERDKQKTKSVFIINRKEQEQEQQRIIKQKNNTYKKIYKQN